MGKKGFLMLVVLVFLAISSVPAAAGDPVAAFVDVGNHWAAGDIEKCSALQLMTGYPGNLFMPDRNLSRAEALAAIGRGLGWDRQAGNVSTEGIEFPLDLWEGFRVFVARAAEKQLIVKEDVYFTKFNDPATRMELALWLAKAFNLRGSGYKLDFTDVDGIPALEKDMLAGVVEAGIIRGLPGNLFNPSGSVTRAQMAAVLARLAENWKISPLGSGSRADDGVVKGDRGYVINKYQDYFTVHLDFGSVVKIRAADVSLLISGYSTTLGSLRRGSPVDLLKSGSAVTAVRILDGLARVYGEIREISDGAIAIKDEDGNTAIYGIDRRTKKVDVYGTAIEDDAIWAGMNVELSLDDYDNVMELRLSTLGRYVEGTVKEIEVFPHKRITVLVGGKNSRTYYLAEDAKVGMLQFDNITKGMNVRIALDSNEHVISININERFAVEGKVTNVNTLGIKQITIIDRNGRSMMYILTDGVQVRDGSKTLEPDKIKEGMDVRLTLDHNNQVTGIEIIDMSTVEGEVSGIRDIRNKWIIVRSDSGQEEAYYLSNSVAVREGSNGRTLDFIDKGMRVKLNLDVLGNVAGIDIIGLRSVTGEVVNIEATGLKKLTVKDSSGQVKTYHLVDIVVIGDGGGILNLDDIKEGKNVKLTLDSRERVVRIEIRNLTATEGEIVLIEHSGTVKIEILKNDGSKEAYSLVGEITVREGNATLGLSDVVKGMRVRLTIDGYGKVTAIDIIGKVSVEGTVTGFSARETDKIRIKKDNGQEETYNLDDSVVVREGNIGREKDYIFEGMRVGLVLDRNGHVTRIDVLGLYAARGTVTLIETSDAKVIVLKGADGENKTYNVGNNVTVSKGSSIHSLGDVREGMDVELVLDSRLQVSHINLL
ncbi:MAG: S-layer homology domain-containing protein [Peptococcaceae bacterium]|nr:S-layer homology domain-containing protein [Peptococcaceae bacterium]